MTHNIHDNISQWMKSNEETPIVMSSRIRLARNLENHVHPLMYATENGGFRVINEVQDALPNFELMR
ncbi:protein arginine kinase, partial [Staphylococcus aureus]|nr:protein arginine kinase [Staphylococcus aureus]